MRLQTDAHFPEKFILAEAVQKVKETDGKFPISIQMLVHQFYHREHRISAKTH